MRQVFEFLAANPVLVLFLLIGIGAAAGRIRVGGVSLGAVAVLFAAMGITAWGVTQDVLIEIPPAVGDTGLVIFAFCIGLVAGAGFFNALKTAWPLMLAVTGILIAGAAAAYGIGTMLGLDAVTIAGTFAGAVTNTPALAATGGSADATVGYASSYIFGVIGALFLLTLAALGLGALARRGARSQITRGRPALRWALAAIGGPSGETASVVLSLGSHSDHPECCGGSCAWRTPHLIEPNMSSGLP